MNTTEANDSQATRSVASEPSEAPVRSSDGLAARWTQAQKDKAWGIVNDIAEDIDNHETRAELRQALAIYADMHHDALQKRACERTEKLMEQINRLAELMAANAALCDAGGK